MGTKGVAPGEVRAPLGRHLSRTEGERRRARAKQVTRRGTDTSLESCRCAEALVRVVDASPQHAGRLTAVPQRLRQARATRHVPLKEAKSRLVARAKGDRGWMPGL